MKIRKEKQRSARPACLAVRSMLLDYTGATGELNSAGRALVKKHLSDCADCSGTARDINAVVAILRSASLVPDNLPSRLSPERRRKILKSFLL